MSCDLSAHPLLSNSLTFNIQILTDVAEIWPQATSRTHRKLMCDVELSGVFELRAATLYLLQYDLWHRKEPPFITLLVPFAGPPGAVLGPFTWKSLLNQSEHHSQVLPVIE